MITINFVCKKETVSVELPDDSQIYATIADLKSVDLNGINSYQINFVDETQEEINKLIDIWKVIKSVDFNNLERIEFFINDKLYRTITDKVVSYNFNNFFNRKVTDNVQMIEIYLEA